MRAKLGTLLFLAVALACTEPTGLPTAPTDPNLPQRIKEPDPPEAETHTTKDAILRHAEILIREVEDPVALHRSAMARGQTVEERRAEILAELKELEAAAGAY